ncbi:sensor histidine kinase [Rhodococcus oryzae]|uniref:Sensor histidine kinase n=1 Tax=Rhodococcus oryzae TaxID=2571143 RepID=A0ABY2RPE5_9NOCA|nr:ATP-binding protein [Rhodococcus oryzae]TJZ79251.1 sensor histidine kinase [Rhodococcus oryzae]
MAGRDRDRVVERYATEAVRVTAVLRLPLIALIALLGPVVRIEHWMPTLFRLVLLGYAVAAAVWLAVVLRRQVRPWAGWASTGVDIAALLALCLASGGATSSLLPVFFLLPVAVAFQYRPALTASLGICTAVGYLLVWIFYAVRDDLVDLPGVVFLYFGFLLWLTAATTALSFVLVRRSGTVISLLDVRRRLVAESMGAEERERRRLAEHLHDGPLQNVLAARMDLEEAIERDRDPALVAAEATLRETAAQLRSTVTTLHPQVLEQLGLTAALRELADGHGRRGGYEMRVRLAEVGRPDCQSLLYRVAREALGNIDKHAHARRVDVLLARTSTAITLEVADDGVGFDPDDLPARVAEGHIGLASQFLRIENLGGTLELTSAPGEGTRVVATVPSS